jgi:hypothetical protein
VGYRIYLVKGKWTFLSAWRVQEVAHAVDPEERRLFPACMLNYESTQTAISKIAFFQLSPDFYNVPTRRH